MSKQREDGPFQYDGYGREVEIHHDVRGEPIGYTVGDPYKLADDERDTPPGVAAIVEDDK